MKQVTLGKTGLGVSNLCLGTMQFGWTADENASFAVMDAFVEAGGNFIDTADIYSKWSKGNPGGVSEEIIGRWMKARGNRDQLIVATKLRGQMWDGPDGEGLSPAHVQRAAENSLRRLQIDTIDLYQCHWPDQDTPIEETIEAFGDLISSGKVRHIGASNYSPQQLDHALEAAADRNLPAFATLQPHYSLVHRSEYEGALEDVCRRHGLGVIPYSPLEGGFLTGKYRRDEPVPDSARAGGVSKFLNDKGFSVLETVEEVASNRGATIPAVALAWQLARPDITAPILGANSPAQLNELLPAAELELTSKEVRKLDEASSGY